jgi:copper homeostasis protein
MKSSVLAMRNKVAMIFEVCVDSIEGAIAAQEAGAQRVELCANLVEGGVTPSLGMIRMTCLNVALGVHVLIRPRGGDFYYSALEIEAMRQDIRAARDASADGVVIGLLLPDGSIDEKNTRELVEASRPMSVTFHRAFDMCADPAAALETLIELGVDQVLTSGQAPTAPEGADLIAALVRQAEGRIGIVAGGGINAGNLPALLMRTRVKQVHFSAREEVDSPMQHRNLNCWMGKRYEPDEYKLKKTRAELIRRVIDAGQEE